MIDLELVKPCEHGQMVFHQWGDGKVIHSCDGGTRTLLDFPTDEQVETAAKTIYEYANDFEWDHEVAAEPDSPYRNMARLMLEAVRDTMIGDEA